MASNALSDAHKRVVQQERALEKHFEVPPAKRTAEWIFKQNELVNVLKARHAAWLALVQLQPRRLNFLTTERKRLKHRIDTSSNASFKRLLEASLVELNPQASSVANPLTGIGGRKSITSQTLPAHYIPSAALTLPQNAEVDLSLANVPSYSASQRQAGPSSMAFQLVQEEAKIQERKNKALSEFAKTAGNVLQTILNQSGGGGVQYGQALEQYRILRRGLITRARERGDTTSNQMNFETRIPEKYAKVLMGVVAMIRESLGLDETMWIARFPQLLNYATFDAELKHVQEILKVVEYLRSWTKTQWNDVEFGQYVLPIWAETLQAEAIASQDATFQAAVRRLLLEAQAIPEEIRRLITQYPPPRSVSARGSSAMAAPSSVISLAIPQSANVFPPPPPPPPAPPRQSLSLPFGRSMTEGFEGMSKDEREILVEKRQESAMRREAARRQQQQQQIAAAAPLDVQRNPAAWRQWLREHPYALGAAGLGAAGLGATAAALARYGPLAAAAASPVVPPPIPPAGFLARTAQQVGNTVLGWFGTAKDTAVQAAERARAAAIAYPYAAGALALGAGVAGAAALAARRMRAAEVENVSNSIQRVSRSAATHPHLSARHASNISNKLGQSATLASQYAVTGNPAALAAAKRLVHSAAREERAAAPKPKRKTTTTHRRRRSTFSLQRRTRMTTRTKRASAPSRLTAAKPKRSSGGGGRRRGRSGRSAARTRRL